MKKHGKKTVLVIAVLCAALGAVFAARNVWTQSLPQHTPGAQLGEHSAEEAAETQTESAAYDSAFFVQLMQDTVQDALPLTALSAEIMDAEEITFTGTLNKETAAKLLQGQNDDISQAYAAILDYLPQELPVSCRLQAAAEGGGVRLTCKQLSAASMELPDSLVADTMLEPLEQRLNDELEKKFGYVTTVQTENGALTVSGRASQ